MEVGPAYRFGVRQGEKLRGVDDLERRAANRAAATHAPIDLPSREHIAQLCELCGREGDRRPLAMAKADHADA